jgi:hypothetical protein
MTTTQKAAPLEPVGVEGCRTCAVLVQSRQTAREAGALDAVAHSNREIANHPHVRAGAVSVWGVAQ